MVDVESSQAFKDGAGAFTWASLQFPGVLTIEGTNVTDSTSEEASPGALTYLAENANGEYPENFFFSSVIVQIATLIGIITVHALIRRFCNYVLKREAPSELDCARRSLGLPTTHSPEPSPAPNHPPNAN